MSKFSNIHVTLISNVYFFFVVDTFDDESFNVSAYNSWFFFLVGCGYF